MTVKYNDDAKETALRSKEKVKWVIYWTIVLAIAIGKLGIPAKKERKFILLILKSKRLKESQILKIKVESRETHL